MSNISRYSHGYIGDGGGSGSNSGLCSVVGDSGIPSGTTRQ